MPFEGGETFTPSPSIPVDGGETLPNFSTGGCENRELIVFFLVLTFVVFIIRILIENYIAQKRKRLHFIVRYFFYLSTFVPAVLFSYYTKALENDPLSLAFAIIGIIFSRYVTSIVVMDYFVLKRFPEELKGLEANPSNINSSPLSLYRLKASNDPISLEEKS
jgi:hypothetical protein